MKWFLILLFTVQILSQERAYKLEQYEAKLERGDTLIFTNVRKSYYMILALLLSVPSTAQIMISDKGYNPPADIFPPSIVSGLSGTVISDDSLLFYWNHSPENDLNKYVVWFMGAVKDSTSNDSIFIGGLSPNTAYGLRVLSVDNNGNRSAYSDSIQRTTLDTVTALTKPAIPTTLTVTDSLDGIDLSWTPNPPNATNFVIMKDGADYDTVAYPTATYSDSDTMDGVFHTYKLYAYNAGGESDTTATVATQRRSSNTYYFSSSGNDAGLGTVESPFKTNGKANSIWLNGFTAKFKAGETFNDAQLVCQEGVTYTSYGTGQAIIGDSTSALTSNSTILIDNKEVTLSNLKIYGYLNTTNVIEFSANGLTIEDCEIVGGHNTHEKWSSGLYQTSATCSTVNIQRNNIHGFGKAAISWSRPHSVDVSYNEMYDLWRVDAKSHLGTSAISRLVATDGNTPADAWDCNYTVNIHHNEVHHFDYMAGFGGYSRMIVEYNEIHSNLDERIYRGGVAHGSVGKLWDDTNLALGNLGIVFRYNYIHDLVRRGEVNKTYSAPNTNDYYTGVYTGMITTNSYGSAVYLYSVGDNNYAAMGNHYGDFINDVTGVPSYGESPDAVLSGLGYGAYYVHNNVFYNCTNQIANRGYTQVSTTVRNDLGCHFINNTIINCGSLDYVTNSTGIFYAQPNCYSPTTFANNIINLTNTSVRIANRFEGDGTYLGYNIYTNQNGFVTVFPLNGAQKATFVQYRADDLVPVSEFYSIAQSGFWNDTSSTVAVANVGVSGVNIPDVRLVVSGDAYNTGKAYSTLGTSTTITSTYWTQSMTLGQDPTGRSFAYDIFGTLRSLNHIGAVKAVGE